MAKPTSRKIRPDHFDRKTARRRANTHILYRCYNQTTTLLYVGMTNDPEHRFAQHRRIQPWWHEVHHIRLQNLPNREALARAEAAAIQMEKPLYNTVGTKITNSGSARTKIGPRNGKGRGGLRLWPEANHFGTREPQDGHLIDMTREQMLYPCMDCRVRGIYCEGDTVACRMCGSEWTYDDWFAMTFLNIDKSGQYRLL